ncbi:MAG: PKD domain-containing protein [Vicinamibacteria bacterium]
MRVRLVGMALAAAAMAGCTLNKQDAPDLAGPSGLSLSLAVTAAPDHLMQDGVSQSLITASARDANGAPIAGLGISWSVSSSDGTQVEPTTQFSVTNAQGRATTAVTAPAPPAQVPNSPVRLRVSAQASGTDSTATAPGFDRNRQSVELELVPPAGTPTANRIPVASFTIVPVIGNINQSITFDASATTDEGVPCDTRCNYLWDFDDFSTDSGKIVHHMFTLPQSYTVTLTVTDGRGGVSSTTRSITVNGPAAPLANFSVLPSTPTVNVAAVLDASSSSVGAGANITQYSFNFGDGAASTGTSPAVNHTWTSVGTYPVVLTVTDSLARTASQTLIITVVP